MYGSMPSPTTCRMLLAACIGITWCAAGSHCTWGAESRTWTDSTGQYKRQGSFQRLDGQSVVIDTADAGEVTVPLDRLSAADQAYARKAGADVEAGDPFRASTPRARPSPRKPDEEAAVTVADVRVVVAKGVGATVEDAKKDAYREAVRQVVGAYVEGDTLTKNDELIEDKVLSLSGGLVQKADVLPDPIVQADGIVRLRVRAEVKVTEVMKSLARLNVTTTSIRTSDVEAQVATLSEQAGSAEALLADARMWETFPAPFFTMKLVGQPRVIEANGAAATAELNVRITPNREQYFAFSDRLSAILAKVAIKSGEFSNNGLAPGGDSVSAGGYLEELYHHVFRGRYASDRNDPAVSWAFPEKYRRGLKTYFTGMDLDQLVKSGCTAYCFDQGRRSSPTRSGCGLGVVENQWEDAIDKSNGESMVVCLLSQANDTFTRTKWRWFLCRRSLFPRKEASPWDRGINCEISLCAADGREITSETIPLGQGFGVSRCNWQRFRPIAMVGPMWIDPDEIDRRGYVPVLTFPVRFDVSASEAKSLTDVRCSVRPLTLEPE